MLILAQKESNFPLTDMLMHLDSQLGQQQTVCKHLSFTNNSIWTKPQTRYYQ